MIKIKSDVMDVEVLATLDLEIKVNVIKEVTWFVFLKKIISHNWYCVICKFLRPTFTQNNVFEIHLSCYNFLF